MRLDLPFLTGSDLRTALDEECVFFFRAEKGQRWYLDPYRLGQREVEEDGSCVGWTLLDPARPKANLARLIAARPRKDPVRIALVGFWSCIGAGSSCAVNEKMAEFSGQLYKLIKAQIETEDLPDCYRYRIAPGIGEGEEQVPF